MLVLALSGVGAKASSAAQPASLCIPILMVCSSPTLSPTPTPAPPAPVLPIPGVPGLPTPGSPTPGSPTPGSPTPGNPAPTAPSPGSSTPPILATPDPNAPTFTLPAAQLTGSSISFTGLHSISVVTVPLANGTRAPVLKLMADDIIIKDFHLNVRKATGPSLLTDAGQMELRGNVQVYVDSVTATLLDGSPITLGAATPPPDNKVPPSLLRVNLGLVGVTANSISLIPSHQALT